MTPRPNLRLVHPLDACQRIRPVVWIEVPPRERLPTLHAGVQWEKLLTWTLVVLSGLACWYGLMLVLWYWFT